MKTMMKLRNCFAMVVAAVLAFMCGSSALAETEWQSADWYVDDDASVEGADGSVDHPYPTIQQAIDAASANQTIYVAEGIYTNGVTLIGETHPYSFARVLVRDKPGLKIVGAGRGRSFIVGSRDPSAVRDSEEATGNRVCCVYVSNCNGAVIEGFTLMDGETYYASKYINGGGGFYANNTKETYLVDCDVRHCSGRVGGAMYYGTAVRCFFEGNYSYAGIVREARLVNCVVARNTSETDGGVLRKCESYNCTVFANNVTLNNGIALREGYACNCIVGLSSKTEFGVETNNAATSVNSVLASAAPNGFRQFLAPGVDDYRLLPSSDAIGAGLASHLSSLSLLGGNIDPMLDFAKKPIVADGEGRINAGAVQESVAPAGGALAFVNGSYEIDGRTSASSSRTATYVYPDTYPTQFCVRAVLSTDEHLYRVERYDPATGTLTRDYPAAIPSRDETMWMMPPSEASVVLTNKSIVTTTAYWVDPETGSDANNVGTSSSAPFATVAHAIEEIGSGKAAVIYLMPGEYTNEVTAATLSGRGNFRISIPDTNRKLRIVSTDGPESTIIRGRPDPAAENGIGSGAIKGAILFANTILQGVTIADCYSSSASSDAGANGAAVFFDYNQGEIAPPQLIDCIVTNCHATSGVTVNYGVIRRCSFYDSRAYNPSQYVIDDVLSDKYGLPLFSCYMRGLSTSGGKGVIGGSARVWQCTVVGEIDRGQQTGAANVSWNSIWYGGTDIMSGSTFTNCFVYRPSGEANGIYAKTNPFFVDAKASGVLCLNSPAIGVGGVPGSDGFSADYWKYALGDIDGNPIAFDVDGRPTLGAFQFPDPTKMNPGFFFIFR